MESNLSSRRIACLVLFSLMASSAAATYSQSNSTRELTDWGRIPNTIHNSDQDDFFHLMSELHQISYVTANQVTPPCHFRLEWNENQKKGYGQWAKQRWIDWWTNSGEFIDQQRRSSARSYPQAWKQAIELLESDLKPEPIPKIWIPEEWLMHLHFKTGDYSIEREHWIIAKSAKDVCIYRMKAVRGMNRYQPLILERCVDVDPNDLEHFLAIVTYIYEYQIRNPLQRNEPAGIVDNEYYYPNGTIRLDSNEVSIWNLRGFEHHSDLKQYSIRSRSSSDLAHDFELNGQKPGLARSVAKVLWDKEKSWRRVFQLGKVGGGLFRKTMYEPVFDRIEGDRDQFAVLAAFGDSKDEDMFKLAIGQLDRIESSEVSVFDTVSREQFHSLESCRNFPRVGKENLKAMQEHLLANRFGKAEIEEDLIMETVATENTRFETLDVNGIAIPVVIK